MFWHIDGSLDLPKSFLKPISGQKKSASAENSIILIITKSILEKKNMKNVFHNKLFIKLIFIFKTEKRFYEFLSGSWF